MKHPTPKEKKRLLVLMEQLDYLFAVNGYERRCLFMKDDDGDTHADITIDGVYERIVMRIYPKFWEQDRSGQRESLLHEYCHKVVWPLQHAADSLASGKLVTREAIDNAVERVTTGICHLLDAQLRERNKYARIAYKKYL